MASRRQRIENIITDMISDFLYYDRKEDEDLSRGAIEDAVSSGEITLDEIVNKFREELTKGMD